MPLRLPPTPMIAMGRHRWLRWGRQLTRPQPHRYVASSTCQRPQSVADFLRWRPEDGGSDATLQDVVVSGYVQSTHRLKSDTFVQVGDGSTLKNLQAIVPTDMAKELRRATAARLHGSWVRSQNPEAQSHELKVHKVEILGPSNPGDYPIQRKLQTAQFLRGLPHLRSRLPINTTILRLRSDAISVLNQFFASRGFIQTHPPIITSSDCEGAGEVFNVTTEKAKSPTKTCESKADSNSKVVETVDSFFRGPKYLSVSTQLHLEALAQSVGNVWTLSPTFRAEKSDTSRHMAEFYMLEAEMPFVEDMTVVMDLVEDMLRNLVVELRTKSSTLNEIAEASRSRVLEKFMLSSPGEVESRWDGMSSLQWPRITYTDAIDLLKKEESRFVHKPEWGLPLQAEHERFIADTVSSLETPGGRSPVFVTHYPRDIKAFYMLTSATTPHPHHPRRDAPPDYDDVIRSGIPELRPTVDCFDLLVPDLCEIAGGSMREHRLEHLQRAMLSRGMVAPKGSKGSKGPHGQASSNLDWYLDLRRWGSPPHGGFGLGFDRILTYLAGVQNIKDVVAFPRWWGRCDC